MQALYVFMGIYKNSYTVTLENNGEFFSFLPKNKKYNDKYTLVLTALKDTLTDIIPLVLKKQEIIFYCPDSDVAYEYNDIYKKGEPLEKIKNIKLWGDIFRLVKKNNLDLKIVFNSYLKSIGDVYGK